MINKIKNNNMETIILNKKAINDLKLDIKEKSEKQKFFKNQIKTKNLVGERKMQPWEATMNHLNNRKELRKMYAVYAILKGKEISKIDSLKFDNEWEKDTFMNDVTKLVNLYNEVNA